ncbi:hypothetical protein TanjilG_06975 [Lupinus angustifolius]|uniref:SAM domain-containing protein n=2 Tax=Lupinus angustifolius TaxID=3871 RepID=A0A1J7IY79_LUPAN|nr:hypothetical protein TanjilG_06975 [Lupinus angustifolius]
MDWFSWLSRTKLDPSLIEDYGLTFARNELQLEDASYFNHEFLQSMGISIAKHRLEILKLVKKEEAEAEAATRPNKKLSKVMNKYIKKFMSKFGFHENHNNIKDIKGIPQPQEGTHVIIKQQHGTEELKHEKLPRVPMFRSRTIALSGPLDHSRMNEKMVCNKTLRLSGPIDGKMHERMMMYTNRSPLISRPVVERFTATAKSPRFSAPKLIITRPSGATRAEIESPICGYSPYRKPNADFDYDDDDRTLWPTLFQDLKPT